ncbi:LysR family transcriptional regulator ArgP [Nocardioides pocheonensis]|uniref:LysR family transcriptional regulator ArgP n=1 Tax=Nocardioides pocheonensis TaxID=661485 RepID=A0A3N0GYM8_9ACTN|nr:LysR family transcriptional regulator ArgP [Nocardioides pocheonensis]RNM17509.1 LysR family transcriptional regulator ArgP [Nocardioides pocheonensis]
MTSVDLAQLAALASVLDEGSFEAAAASLNLTPSAVSQRIKALERSAGQVLVRRARPAAATEAGETYLRLARQITALVDDVRREIGERAVRPVVPLAVNADSLATWVLPALATVSEAVVFDLRREDQAHTAELLRSGAVIAAITSEAEPVQGCRSTRLGTMRYRPVAARSFAGRWFADGVNADSLSEAPVVVFDRRDHLQDDYLRKVTRRRIAPPRHYVPSSSDYAEAIRLGLGWGMLPRQQYAAGEAAGDLVVFDTARQVGVTLYWQQWSLRTPALDAVAEAIRSAADAALD